MIGRFASESGRSKTEWRPLNAVNCTGVSRFSVGDRVYGRMPLRKIGAFAETAAIDQNAIAKVPEYLSNEEAACVPLTALTAQQAFALMKPKAGERSSSPAAPEALARWKFRWQSAMA